MTQQEGIRRLAIGLALGFGFCLAPAQDAGWEARARAALPELRRLYEDLHAHPELSLHEERTAGVLAGRLRALGYEVTTGVGGHGLVALLRNGPGPTVMLRTDLDALPVEEKTGLPYASRATGVSPDGSTVPTMHACAHDLHMTALVGTATLLAQGRDRWQGTLMLVGQPAEEITTGATEHAGRGTVREVRAPRRRHRRARQRRPAGRRGRLVGGQCAGELRLRRYRDPRPRRPRRLPAPHGRSDRHRIAHRAGAADARVARDQPARAGGDHRRLLSRRHQAQHHSRPGRPDAHGARLFRGRARAAARRHRADREGRGRRRRGAARARGEAQPWLPGDHQ